jgi:hypothetical protein
MTATESPLGPAILRVQLTARSNTALHHAAEMMGDTETDTINRALQLYAQLAQAVEDGGRVLIAMPDEDEATDLGLRAATVPGEA